LSTKEGQAESEHTILADLAELRKVAKRTWNNRSSNPKTYRKALKEYDTMIGLAVRNSVLRGGIFVVVWLHKILAKDEGYQ
jgi:hypothetical protein